MLNRFVILSLVLGFSNIAHAGGGKFTFTQEGAPAPFTGTLLDPEATAKILAQSKFLRDEYNLKLAYELSAQEWVYKLELDQMQITLDTEKSRYESTLILKDTEIEQLNKIIAKKPGQKSVTWGIVGGFAAGVASTVAIVQAANK